MAQAHVYVRVQVTGSDAQVLAIQQATNSLKDAVEAAGGEWKGDASVSLDAVEPVEPAVVEAVSVNEVAVGEEPVAE